MTCRRVQLPSTCDSLNRLACLSKTVMLAMVHGAENRLIAQSAELRGSCCRGGNRMKSAGQSLDCRFGIGAQSVPPRKPSRIVVGKPGTSISALPNQKLQRQIDANCWRQLHEWCSYLGIAEY